MDRRTFAGLVAAGAATAVTAPALTDAADAAPARRGGGRRRGPIVVGHRGASGYRPEHTLASYELAARMGADFIEPDLVITKDGVLVCRHEPEIGGTTDVADRPEFASRRTTKDLDGKPTTGWFAEDFTLAELRTLRAVERVPEIRPHNTVYDGLWQVPTFAEVLQLRQKLSRELRREIGIYPETKHPTYFREMGLPLEEKVVQLVRRFGLDHRRAPIFLQSFELKNLLDMRTRLRVKAPLVFLATGSGSPYGDDRSYDELLSRRGMKQWAHHIDGIGPDMKRVIAWNADGTLGKPTSLVADAHANRLSVCPYTVRAENEYLPTDYRVGTDPADFGRVLDFFEQLWKTGIDGIFTDMPDLGVLSRELTLGVGAR